MDSKTYQVAQLVSKYLQNNLSEDEMAALQQWLEESPKNEEVLASFRGRQSVSDMEFLNSIDVAAGWERLTMRNRKNRWKRIAKVTGIAAAIAVVAFSWARFSTKTTPELETASNNRYINDVAPGGDRALLRLSDGRLVDLEAYRSGLEERDGTQIINSGGQVTYAKGTTATGELIYNTLVVPKAGTFQITLSDGTKVWLNAMSELRFPVHFGQGSREVFLQGEAYFEVAHDAKKPFHVNVNGNKVEVLGTHFNINAYRDVMSATLVEGSVRVSNPTGERVLAPGQEAKVGEQITVQPANIDKAIAWKQGDFYFKRDNIDEIMGQLSRWYDVEVKYESAYPANKGYSGAIRRDVNISQVLEMLSYVSGAVFTIEGNTVTIAFE
ncbi:FecR family protein [Parapedobacter koreensis]|uniref:FecR family protein n=1 Tax=Parapedobacter koreensis TaxID=332977 RepID=A0A1H7RSP3_9SPHI|nr:FecR family protein [Parapedobacter koreensis]SEL63018.1 FecR family protein [Parapedobacter koreensis]